MGTPLLGHGREVPRWWPQFGGFSIRLGPYFIPLSAEKIGLPLSHLVSGILGPKVGLIIHQNVLTDFKHFVYIFSLNFDPIEPLFHWFKKCLIPHFHKTLHQIGSNIFSHAEPGYRTFDEVPHTPPRPENIFLNNYTK